MADNLFGSQLEDLAVGADVTLQSLIMMKVFKGKSSYLASLLSGESRVPVAELFVRNIGIQSQLLALPQIDLGMVIAIGGKNLPLKVVRFVADAL